MAFAAVISLKQTIHRLLNSSYFFIGHPTRQILQSAHEEAKALQEVLERFDDGRFRSSRRLDAVDGEIRDAVRELEDVLDQSHVPADPFLSESQNEGLPRKFSLDLGGDEISSFADIAKKMKEDYIEELDNALLKQEDEDGASSSTIDFGVEMVGFSNEFTSLKGKVLKCSRPYEFGVCSVIGEAGTGRTIVGKIAFEEICRLNHFDCSAWVSVGRNYDLRDILATILAQIEDEAPESVGDEENIDEYLHGCLQDMRYIIVLDDVWDAHLWDQLKSSFPEVYNGSMVLLTTSLREVALSANSCYIHRMRTYGEEESWHLIQRSLDYFDDDELIMTPEMEEVGRKIAKNCRGLCFAITKVSFLLAAGKKTPEYWKKVAADEHNPVFMVADEISEKCEFIEDLKIKFSWDEDLSDFGDTYFDYTNDLERIKREMFQKTFFPKMKTIAVLGTAGIGKTTLVKKIFGDPSILCHFDHRVWLTLGPKCQSKELLVDILAQIHPNADRERFKRERTLSKYLRECLSSKRCLVVLDDIWTTEPLQYLKRVLLEVHGKVILTTRLLALEQDGFSMYDSFQHVSLLSKKESWQLFCQKVFVDGSCPSNLEKVGRRISENCEGLPLLILTVADLLSKTEKTLEYWNKVAEEQSTVFMEAYHKLSKVLLPSYRILPQHLKACFLYMGVFSQKYKISTTKLINYWIVEGLLEPNTSQDIRSFAAKCLIEISNISLNMVLQKGLNFRIKTSALHCVFWYLSNSEAAKNKFFHAMRKRSDSVLEDRKGQRRLCIRNNVLFAIKDVHASLASFSSTRSLLCTGPRHQYPVPMCFGLRLLRVLCALTIRFYEFPIEVVKLIHLRYLALICSTGLPPSISKLQNLQFLIVDRHLRIKSSNGNSYMPMEIWDMKELNHLQIMGSNLPDPKHGVFLLNLSTLLDVSADSCTEKVLEGIPYLKKLRIQIEFGP